MTSNIEIKIMEYINSLLSVTPFILFDKLKGMQCKKVFYCHRQKRKKCQCRCVDGSNLNFVVCSHCTVSDSIKIKPLGYEYVNKDNYILRIILEEL